MAGWISTVFLFPDKGCRRLLPLTESSPRRGGVVSSMIQVEALKKGAGRKLHNPVSNPFKDLTEENDFLSLAPPESSGVSLRRES